MPTNNAEDKLTDQRNTGFERKKMPLPATATVIMMMLYSIPIPRKPKMMALLRFDFLMI